MQTREQKIYADRTRPEGRHDHSITVVPTRNDPIESKKMKSMHYVITASAFALAFGLSGVAHAEEPAGHSFCQDHLQIGNEVNDVRTRISNSLKADPTGNRALEGCRVTPRILLARLQQTDEKAGLNNLGDLDGYFAGATTEVAKADSMYDSDCLWDQPGGGVAVKVSCRPRDIKKGEVLIKSRTGAIIALSWCFNTGVIEVPPIVSKARHCVEVDAPDAPGGYPVRFAHMDDKPLPGICTAIQLVGDDEPRDNLPDECPMSDSSYRTIEYTGQNGQKLQRVVKVVCTWTAVEQAASGLLGRPVRVQNVSGSYKSRGKGYTRLVLDAEAMDGEVAFCYTLSDGTVVTVGVRRHDYIDSGDGRGLVATIPRNVVYGD